MDVALIEHAEDDVDGQQRGGDQHRLIGQQRPECLRIASEAAG
jgi:hypothetical protein